MKSMSREQLDALLNAAKQEIETDWLMLLVTFNHGLRVSETLSLTRENIRHGYISVERGKGSLACQHPLLSNERAALEKLATDTAGRLFPISRMTFWRKMKKYGEAAGLPEFLRHPHSLKHTTGRLGFVGGMTVPDLVAYLGHVNPANSLIYAQSDIATASAAFAAAIGGQSFAASAGGK